MVAGAVLAAGEILARAVGAEGGDAAAFAEDLNFEGGGAVGAVERPAADAVGADHVEGALQARRERHGFGGLGGHRRSLRWLIGLVGGGD